MASRTPAWKWVLGSSVLTAGAVIALPLARYAENDDAPGGVVIAVLIFVGAVALATKIVK